MSDSPTSTRLETPLSTRTSRARKPVKHYGSFLDSDQLPEDEDHQEEDDVVDDEDESFKVKGGKEESEDEVEGDEIVLGDGSEDEIDFKPKKGSAKAKTAKEDEQGSKKVKKEKEKESKVKTPNKVDKKPIVLPKGPKKVGKKDERESGDSSVSPSKGKRPAIARAAKPKPAKPVDDHADDSDADASKPSPSADEDDSPEPPPTKKPKPTPAKPITTAKANAGAKAIVLGAAKKGGFTPLVKKAAAPTSGSKFVPLVPKGLTSGAKQVKDVVKKDGKGAKKGGVAVKNGGKAVKTVVEDEETEREDGGGRDEEEVNQQEAKTVETEGVDGDGDKSEEDIKLKHSKSISKARKAAPTKKPAKAPPTKKAVKDEEDDDKPEESVDNVAKPTPSPKTQRVEVEIPTPPSKLTQSTKIIKKTPPPAEEADKVDEEELQVKSPLQEAKKAGTKATPRLKSDTSSSKTSQGSDEPYIEKRWPPKVNRESDGSEASSLETAKPDKTAAIPKPELIELEDFDYESPEEGESDAKETGNKADKADESEDDDLGTTVAGEGMTSQPSPPRNKEDQVMDLDDDTANASENTDRSQSDSSAKPTVDNKRKRSSETDSSPKKSKPAPAEKVTSDQRVAIIDALTNLSFTKKIDFGKVAGPFSADGATSIKLSRHWREVLSGDLKTLFRSGGSAKSAKGSGKIGSDQRRAIWIAICEAADRADWKSLEDETGVSATKLKRHLNESMRKEGDNFLKS